MLGLRILVGFFLAVTFCPAVVEAVPVERGLTVSMPVEIVATGEAETVPLKIRAADLAPNDDAVLELRVNIGQIRKPVARAGTGTFFAELVLPGVVRPAVVSVVATLRSKTRVLHGAAHLTLLGGGEVEAEAQPGAMVELEFAGRVFRAQQADATGKVRFTLQGVPPGETVYHIKVIGEGAKDARITRTLRTPSFPRITIGPLPARPSVGGASNFAVAAVTASGTGYPSRRLNCRSGGAKLPRLAVMGELAVFAVPEELMRRAAGRKLTVSCFDREGHVSEASVDIQPLKPLPSIATAPALVPPPTPTIAEPAADPGIAPWVTLGVAAVAAGAGVILGGLALADAAAANGEFANTPAFKRERDAAKGKALAADISYAVAAVAGLGALLLFDNDSDEQANP